MDLLAEIKKLILEVLEDKAKLNSFNALQVYAFTNENIAGYTKELEMNPNGNVLTICSGGDHLLNLGVKKFRNINLIDINPMAEYFTLGIKLPLVLASSFDTFKKRLEFLFKSKNYDLDLEKKLLYGLLPFMSLKYKLFFKEVFDYYFNLQEKYHVPVKLMQILTTDYYFNMDEITFYNLYLQGEENFNTLKDTLKCLCVSFQRGNIFDINEKDTYELIMCSNALEYAYIPNLDMTGLKEFFSNLRNSLNDNGAIYATYMYGLYDKITDSYENFPIKGTDITNREVLKENLIILDSFKNANDAVLVLRK